MTNDLSMKELLEQQDQELKNIKAGQVITGKISKITNDEVNLELNYGFDGVISYNELNIPKGKYINDIYKLNDEITAIITKVYHKDGIIQLSKLELDKKSDLIDLEKAFNEHRIITVNVKNNIERGAFAKYNTQSLFIPISQLDTKFVSDTSKYIGRNLEVYIKEFNLSKNRIVASHREVLQERLDIEREERKAKIKAEKEEAKAKAKAEKEELFNSLEVGQKREGKVTKLMPYGAFVDIGGLEGLVHLNNLSWTRVESVEEVLQEGQEIEVYVLDVDKDTRKIALALKDINNDPWDLIKNEVEIDTIIKGKVVRIIEKGAFLQIKEGVEAFLPISELSEERVLKVTNVINIGDVVDVMILDFNHKTRRMLVSIKEANKEPEEDYSEFLEVEDSLGSIGDLFKDKFKGLKL